MIDGSAERSPVETWFGEGFSLLHPQLQDLHRHGGRLVGNVNIHFGRGLLGLLGRRVAKHLGIPLESPSTTLVVDIGHDGRHLCWNRQFGNRHRMCSTFTPQGHWPQGYWVERTGGIQLELGVGIVDRAWHWRHERTRIDAGRYRFSVSVCWQGAELLSYIGQLALQPQPATRAE